MDNNTEALASELRIVCEAKNIPVESETFEIKKNSDKETHSEEINWKLANITTILIALGDRLTSDKIQSQVS